MVLVTGPYPKTEIINTYSGYSMKEDTVTFDITTNATMPRLLIYAMLACCRNDGAATFDAQ